MAKFAQIAKGQSARLKGVSFTSLRGVDCVCDLRILTGDDDEAILEAAMRRAADKGAAPKKGDPVFDFACACESVFRSAVDPDSPADAPAAFFDSVDVVRAELDRDRIAYLSERQAAFQDTISPLKKSLSAEEYQAKILQMAAVEAGDATPFDDMGRSLLIDCLRTTARLFLSSAISKSPSFSSSSPEASSKKKSSPDTSTATDDTTIQ